MLMNAAHAHEQHERHIISEAERLAKEEGFTHVRSKSMSRTGFKGVHMRVDKFAAVLKCAGTNELLGITATAEEAALLYARRLGPEASASAAATAELMTAAEVEHLAAAEGLTLVRSSRSQTKWKGVRQQKGRLAAYVTKGALHIGTAATAEEAAL